MFNDRISLRILCDSLRLSRFNLNAEDKKEMKKNSEIKLTKQLTIFSQLIIQIFIDIELKFF